MLFRNLLALNRRGFQQNSLVKQTMLHRFTSLTAIQNDLNFKNPFKMTIQRKNEDLFEVEVLFANEAVKKSTTIQTDGRGTVGQLVQGLKEKYKLEGNIKAYSLDKKELSNTILIDDLEGSNFYIADLSNKLLFEVNNQDIDIKNEYQTVDTYCKDINLSFIEKQVILNYLNRVDNIVRMKNGQEIFSDEYQNQGNQFLIKKDDLVKSMIEALPINKNSNTEYQAPTLLRYQELQKIYSELTQKKAQIEQISHQQVKRYMALGFVALVGQFAFVGLGTYHIWSWDIVEPMAYFLTSGGLIYLNTQFFKYFDDYSNEGFYEYLKKRQLQKLYPKYQFDNDQYLLIEEELHSIERQLKSMLLTNL